MIEGADARALRCANLPDLRYNYRMPVIDDSVKERMIRLIQELPDDSSYDEILKELAFARMVDRGLADADAGRIITDEEMKRTIDSWAK